MSSQVLKIGDKVVGIGEQSGVKIEGMVGRIVRVMDNNQNYSVEFDGPMNWIGHNCGGFAHNHRGWDCDFRKVKRYIPDWD